MNIVDQADLTDTEFGLLENELADLNTLGKVLAWAGAKNEGECISQIVLEVIAHDEYTQDVVVPFKDLFLVFEST